MKLFYENFFDEDMRIWGYTDCSGLMEELYLALDVLFSMAEDLQEQKGIGLWELQESQIARLAADETAQYRRAAKQIGEHIESRIRETAPDVRLPFAEFAERMGLSGWQKLSLLVGSICDRKAGYGRRLAQLQGKSGRQYAVRGLVCSLIAMLGGDCAEVYQDMLAEQEFLRVCFETSRPVLGEALLEEPLVLKKRLFQYFYGQRAGTDAGTPITWYEPDGRKLISFHEQKSRELYRVIQASPGPDIVLLQGREGSGRKFLLKCLSEENEKMVLFVKHSSLQRATDIREVCDLLYLELLLEDAFLCITDCPERKEEEDKKASEQEGDILVELLSYMKRRGEMVFATTTGRLSKQLGEHLQSAEIVLKELDGRKRREAWRFFLGELKAEFDISMLGNRYVLNAGEIEQVVHSTEFYRIGEEREAVSERDILRALRQYHANRLSGYAQLLEAACSFEDLVIADGTRELLSALCSRMKFRNLVGEDWGLYGKTTYGKGICALFYGPPGTGKTMAAQVLANELGLDLYRIDLSRMMSKYIGETEKNISKLFERAANINALLFFDEADAFFSKRTQVNDSHDRSANGEVAHLLQKLEEYEGISVLATNLKDNMDDAFKRRIKYMIPFPFPDAAARKLLWHKMLPASAPREEELELDWFAENFEMAGSEIREVLMQAAVQAAEEGSGIRNSHIADAIRRCLEKYGKIVTDEEFGYLL